MNRLLSILLLFLFLAPFIGFAQDDRQIDRDKWNDIRDKIRYGKNNEEGTGQKWTYSDIDWEKLKGKEKKKVQTRERRLSTRDFSRRQSSSSTNITPGISSGLATFLYILIAAILLALIAYILIKYYKRNPKVQKITYEEQLEQSPQELSLSELQMLLNKALQEENYREAIRIYFIFILKELSERKWIDWKKDKTNLSYLREMRKKSEFSLFKTAVNIFDVVWYGTDHIDKQSFDRFEPEMKKLHKKLGIK